MTDEQEQQLKDQLFQTACEQMNQKNIKRAIYLFRRALEVTPDCRRSLTNLGNCLRDTGDINGARELFERLVDEHPTYALGYYNLSLVSDLGSNISLRDQMRHLLSSDVMCDMDAVYLGYALGKLCVDGGEADTAFDFFCAANDRYKLLLNIKHDNELTSMMCDRTIEVFSKSFLQRKKQAVNSNRKPIFVVGMPRSGSTLVEQILSSHSEVYGCGEVNFVKHILYDEKMLDRSHDYIPKDIENIITDKSCRTITKKYWSFVREKAGRSTDIVDKNLLNFWYLGFIHLAFPNAIIVHCRRETKANIYSCYTNLFFEAQRYTYDLKDLVAYYSDYVRLMKHWTNVLPKDVLVEIHLDDLVKDPEQSIRRLVANCGLTWQEQCLQPHMNRRTVSTASAAQVRQPINPKARNLGEKFEAALEKAFQDNR